jgi:hypothetical protein
MRTSFHLLLFVLTLQFVTASSSFAWLDRSPTIFLPSKLSGQLEAQQSFPIFWWNFLVLEFEDEPAGFKQVSEICDVLKSQIGVLVSKTGCRQDITQFKSVLADWSQDQFLRHESPSARTLAEKLDTALAKASLPAGDAILSLLRMDPLESYKELQNHVEAGIRLKLKKKSGFFIDEEGKKLVIPIQMNFPPFATSKTVQLKNLLEPKYGAHLTLMGPHASTLENEAQVTRDLEIVSTTGTALLVLLAIGVLASRRWKLLLIVPPILLSTLVSALLTIAWFGSIHGLTLSFGSGIIGIAIDFGLHSIFNRHYSGIQKANSFGLYTTLVALIVMMFSSIPLLKQIMVFATLGITSGFLILYVLDRTLPKLFDAKPFPIKPRASVTKLSIAALFVIFAFIGVATLKLSLDISQFDFQSPKTRGLNTWLFRNFDSKPPLLQIDQTKPGQSPLEFAHDQKSWADTHSVRYEGIANYLPRVSEQQSFINSWSVLSCSNDKEVFTPLQQKVFDPFIKSLACGHLKTRTLAQEEPIEAPTYLRDFQSTFNKGSWISLFLPQTDAAVDQTKAQYPSALSLKEVVLVFPRTLVQELKWMVPVSFVLTVLLLAFYFRRLYPTLLSLIPFFSGFGLFTLVSLVGNYNTSFITIIGLVMVFGFSVDYGIFATDLAIGKKRSAAGVWSALSLSALTAATGFVPLLFCQHPVLVQLGQPLVFGTIGTYVGTIWGIPGCAKYLMRFEVKTE